VWSPLFFSLSRAAVFIILTFLPPLPASVLSLRPASLCKRVCVFRVCVSPKLRCVSPCRGRVRGEHKQRRRVFFIMGRGARFPLAPHARTTSSSTQAPLAGLVHASHLLCG